MTEAKFAAVHRQCEDQDLGAVDGDVVRRRLRRHLRSVPARRPAPTSRRARSAGSTSTRRSWSAPRRTCSIPSLMVFATLVLRPQRLPHRQRRAGGRSTGSRSSPARSASGPTTSSAASSSSPCSRRSRTTPGRGRSALARASACGSAPARGSPGRRDRRPSRSRASGRPRHRGRRSRWRSEWRSTGATLVASDRRRQQLGRARPPAATRARTRAGRRRRG